MSAEFLGELRCARGEDVHILRVPHRRLIDRRNPRADRVPADNRVIHRGGPQCRARPHKPLSHLFQELGEGGITGTERLNQNRNERFAAPKWSFWRCVVNSLVRSVKLKSSPTLPWMLMLSRTLGIR